MTAKATQQEAPRKASCACDMQIVLLCLELVVGALLLVIGIVGIFGGSFSNIVRSVYLIIAGALTVFVALMYVDFIRKYFMFLYTFAGRGGWFLFWGILSLPGDISGSIAFICGIIATVIGIIYLVCACFMKGNPKAMCGNNASS